MVTMTPHSCRLNQCSRHVGTPAMTAPNSWTPWRDSDRREARTVAPTTATSAVGSRGLIFSPTTITPSVPSASTIDQAFTWLSWCASDERRDATDAPPDVTPKTRGNWCTTMMMPMPLMKPATIGSERKSASHASFKTPTSATSSPVTSAVVATSERYCGESGSAMRNSATANNGAIVESAPIERIGLEPRNKKTAVAAMKAIIDVKAGTEASWDVANCSGMAMASNVTPAKSSVGTFCRLSPRNVWLSPRAPTLRSMGVLFATGRFES